MVNDTIAAIVTALGAASVGIIRLSGSEAINIADKVYKGKINLRESTTHTIQYGKVFDPRENKIIDEALFLIMKEPKTFTGEDVVEIQCHGGMVPVKKVLEIVLNNGARLAEPGEFSKRAFINGKLDLAQAESIMDIVNAKTEKSLDVAVNQLQGFLSKLVKEVRNQLLRLIAFIEADIDFPDDDIERLSNKEQLEIVNQIKSQLEEILDTSKKGKIIKEGLNAVIIGKPNVGKSSLLNALLKESRAIVTDIPGTTRDAIEEFINLGGIPIKIIDTAGIRETEDLVEKIGVDKAKELIKRADLVLFVLDVESGLTEDDLKIINNYLNNIPAIVLLNKIDLENSSIKIEDIKSLINNKPIITISAREKIGIDKLEEYIIDMFFEGNIKIANDDLIITNIRHVNSLIKSIDHLEGVRNALNNALPGDFLAIDLRGAWESLGQITGDTIEDDLLDQIFSQFCLGK